ncbi:5048_t:CDS:2, partial [Gigaspora margarita]
WDENELLETSLENIQFRPFAIKVENLIVYVTSLGIENNINMMGAGIRYISSFIGKFKKKHALFVQAIKKDNCKITIYISKNESIVVLGKTPDDAWKNIISSKTISKARAYCNINGPGCLMHDKPTITRVRISKENKRQFENFFFDKNKVNLSSYKVNKYGLPLKYLKDQKEKL